MTSHKDNPSPNSDTEQRHNLVKTTLMHIGDPVPSLTFSGLTQSHEIWVLNKLLNLSSQDEISSWDDTWRLDTLDTTPQDTTPQSTLKQKMLPIKQLIKILLLWPSSANVGSAGVAAFIGGKSSIGWQHSTQNHKRHIILLPSSCPSITKRAHLTMQASLPMDDPRVEPRVMHKIDISLPLGLTLEEMDSDPSCGVVVVGISPAGNADLISNADTNTITLEIGRLQGSTVVNYDNGLCISAKPGENYGFLASKCNVDINYECRSGACQTCMAMLEFPNKRNEKSDGGNVEYDGRGSNDIHRRTIFHCIGKVPRNYDWLQVLTDVVRWKPIVVDIPSQALAVLRKSSNGKGDGISEIAKILVDR
eukprot:scaffold1054_cov103-Skeletonema_dohrnii-CCMP3373.AAC.3